MKSKLLVTTAALALTIAAGAHAQTRSDAKPDQPAATQSQKERGSATKHMNRSDAGQADRAKEGTTTGQSPSAGSASSNSPSADDAKSGDRKPASAAQDKSAPPRNSAAQSGNDKSSKDASSKPSGKASDTANDKTNAAGANDKSTAFDRSKQATEPADSKSTTAGQTDSKQPSAAQRDTGDRSRDTAADTKSETGTRVSASLKTEQQTRLREAVTKLDVKPVTNVNFSVSVGTTVPRTISLHPVPATIVEIVPQYRGYDYFVVREQVIIVHPETHRIVDVIERGGASRASVSTTREKRVNLSDKQRGYIRQHVTSRRTTTTTGAAARGSTTVVIGEEVPRTVEIESFPEEVYREVPTVREYRYIRSGTGVYLVEPGTRRVIEEID